MTKFGLAEMTGYDIVRECGPIVTYPFVPIQDVSIRLWPSISY